MAIRELAQADPVAFVAKVENGAVIDEIQRVPHLLSQIQVTVDRAGRDGLFVLTGSSQLKSMESVSQSLAGRTALLKLLPLTVSEARRFGRELPVDELIYTGFYPRIYDRGLEPTRAMGDYFETYVERDVRGFAAIRDLTVFERFMRLCAGRIGQLLKLESLSNDLGVSAATVKHWLSILEASFVVFLLQPYHANIRKRLVKTPKLYFYDVGLAAYLLGIEKSEQVFWHPLRGSLFENLVIAEIIKHRYNNGKRPNVSFYRDAKGNEADLLIDVGGRLYPVEVKAAQTVGSDFFKGFEAVERAIGDRIGQKLLVYAGDRDDERKEAIVTNIDRLPARLDALGI